MQILTKKKQIRANKVPNDGDGDEAESELRRGRGRDEREREAESELRSGLSCDGDKGERQRRESD